MRDYYVPKNKSELITALTRAYPGNSVSHWAKMKRGQLYAILFKTREARDESICKVSV